MPIPQEILKRAHRYILTEITDQGNQYSFSYDCFCGLHGDFFSKEEAEAYKGSHLANKHILDKGAEVKSFNDPYPPPAQSGGQSSTKSGT